MCKGKDGICVNGMMSLGRVLGCIISEYLPAIFAGKTRLATQKGLDTTLECIISNFTELHGRPATDQTIISPRQRHTQPAAIARKQRDIPGQRFLRSRRSA